LWSIEFQRLSRAARLLVARELNGEAAFCFLHITFTNLTRRGDVKGKAKETDASHVTISSKEHARI